MAPSEGPCRTLAVDVEKLVNAPYLVLFELAGVVRYVEQQRQLGMREELREYLTRQVADDLPVGKRAVGSGTHGADIAPTKLRGDGRAGELAIGQRDTLR